MKLKELDILSDTYEISYKDNMIEVDANKRETLFGSYDPLTKKIRIYQKDKKSPEIIKIILHEAIHAICVELGIDMEEKDLNNLSIVLIDMLIRNKLINPVLLK